MTSPVRNYKNDSHNFEFITLGGLWTPETRVTDIYRTQDEFLTTMRENVFLLFFRDMCEYIINETLCCNTISNGVAKFL